MDECKYMAEFGHEEFTSERLDKNTMLVNNGGSQGLGIWLAQDALKHKQAKYLEPVKHCKHFNVVFLCNWAI